LFTSKTLTITINNRRVLQPMCAIVILEIGIGLQGVQQFGTLC